MYTGVVLCVQLVSIPILPNILIVVQVKEPKNLVSLARVAGFVLGTSLND
jgi:hypothetical protein